MARGLLVAVILLAVVPVAAADEEAEGAVAPAQVVLDEAASIVRDARSEAVRTGRGVEAQARADALVEFTARFEEPWSIPQSATRRDDALAALAFARELAVAFATVPTELGASGAVSCSKAHDVERLLSSAALARARSRLGEILERAPAPLDTEGFRDALELLVPIETRCEAEAAPGTAERRQLLLVVRPPVMWPGGKVNVVVLGTTGQPVTVTAPTWAFAEEVANDTLASFEVQVPPDASGVVVFEARSGNVNVTATVAIEPTRSTLRLTGPRTAAPGSTVTLTVRLSTFAPELSDVATIRLTGATNATVRLVEGVAKVSVVAPTEPGTYTVGARFPGSSAIRPAAATHDILVEALAARAGGDAAVTASRTGLIVVALVVFAGVGFVLRRTRRRARPVASTPVIGEAPVGVAIEAAQRGLVLAFVDLRRRFLSLGLARPATTAREMLPALAERGVDGEAVVSAFEALRYGAAPVDEPSGWRAWIDRAIAAVRRPL